MANINRKFNIRISKSVVNVAKNYVLRMYDDAGIRIFEITTESNGQDTILIDDRKMKVNDILEEIYEWSQAYSQEIIEKIDEATDLLDSLNKTFF